jgi:hypothetical protein
MVPKLHQIDYWDLEKGFDPKTENRFLGRRDPLTLKCVFGFETPFLASESGSCGSTFFRNWNDPNSFDNAPIELKIELSTALGGILVLLIFFLGPRPESCLPTEKNVKNRHLRVDHPSKLMKKTEQNGVRWSQNRKNRLFDFFTLKWPQSPPLHVGIIGEMFGKVLNKLWPFWLGSIFFFFFFFCQILLFFFILEKYHLKNDLYLELRFSVPKKWPSLVLKYLEGPPKRFF